MSDTVATNQKDLHELPTLLSSVNDKIKVCWMFGSFAKHENNEKSDFDVVVVLKDKKDRESVESKLAVIRKLDATYFEENDVVERSWTR